MPPAGGQPAGLGHVRQLHGEGGDAALNLILAVRRRQEPLISYRHENHGGCQECSQEDLTHTRSTTRTTCPPRGSEECSPTTATRRQIGSRCYSVKLKIQTSSSTNGTCTTNCSIE